MRDALPFQRTKGTTIELEISTSRRRAPQAGGEARQVAEACRRHSALRRELQAPPRRARAAAPVGDVVVDGNAEIRIFNLKKTSRAGEEEKI